MKVKHTILIFIIGIMFNIVDALFKITHWGNGNLLLTIGTILEMTGGLLFLYKLFTRDKSNNFFNS